MTVVLFLLVLGLRVTLTLTFQEREVIRGPAGPFLSVLPAVQSWSLGDALQVAWD